MNKPGKFSASNWPTDRQDWEKNHRHERLLISMKKSGHFYAIAQYDYKEKTGYCKPYFRAYLYPDGNRITTGTQTEYKTFMKAVKACKEHYFFTRPI